MSDRELLELAAKAAGIEIKVVIGDTFWRPDGITWNPLTDDGDALRLAVKLSIAVYPPDNDSNDATASVPYPPGEWITEQVGADPYAATRRAIVRAAAEIGRKCD